MSGPCRGREGRRAEILGTPVDVLGFDEAAEYVLGCTRGAAARIVVAANVYTVMMGRARRDGGAMRRIVRAADLVVPDGMPLVWAARLLGHRQRERVYGPDLMLAVCERGVPRGVRHYFYGGAPGVADRLAEALARRFPGLRVAGAHSPPFRALTPAEDAEDVARINASGADIVWVGLGAPKQERWMAAHARRLAARVMVGVGAAFDFHTGTVRQAPRWMRRVGLEWLYRLSCEPRRLWRRYLLNNPLFVVLFLLQWAGLGPGGADRHSTRAASPQSRSRS